MGQYSQVTVRTCANESKLERDGENQIKSCKSWTAFIYD